MGQDAIGQVAPQANRAGDDDGFLLGQLVEMLAKLVDRDVDETGDRAQLIFRLGTDVDTDRVVGQVGYLSPADDPRLARQDILGYETCHVYRILGGRVGGRIGVLQFGQVVNGALPLDCLGQHLNSFVYPFEADDLRAKQVPVVGREEDFYRESRRAGIVSGVRGAMRVGGDVGDALSLQQLGIGARRRYGQVTYLGDGGTHRTLIGRAVAEDDVVGDDTPLLVRRTCQWDHGLLAGYEVIDLDRVAQGVDILVGGSQVIVDRDAPQLADGQTGLFRQLGLGSHANAQDHHIGRDPLATVQEDGHVALVVLEFGHAILEDQMQSLLCEVLVYDCGHRVIEWGHYLVGHLDNRGLDAQFVQVLRHLKADEATTDNHR